MDEGRGREEEAPFGGMQHLFGEGPRESKMRVNLQAGRTPERTCLPERSTSGHQRAAGSLRELYGLL
uniref:Uncharacterized protein n=1 Tax=Oryza meridionalis TaxID=40149 RepID=A0A0E0CBD0_9ORYZ